DARRRPRPALELPQVSCRPRRQADRRLRLHRRASVCKADRSHRGGTLRETVANTALALTARGLANTVRHARHRPRRARGAGDPRNDTGMAEPLQPDLITAARQARAWPFEEARKIVKRLETLPGGAARTVIFETGYGPSGLPHIGTFGEVARTAMVRHAFEVLTEGRHKTRLVCFSHDMHRLPHV